MHLTLVRPVSAAALATVLGCSLYTPTSQAIDFGRMMNPSRWMTGDRRYDDGPYDYPGPYGAPYGMPYGVPGFGAPPPGYGAPNGWYPPPPGAAPMTGPAPAAAAAAPAAPTPSAGGVDQHEVEALKRRVDELEARQREQTPAAAPRPPQSNEWPAAPAFRPMNQY